jgi:type I restriction enzyme S subunit
MKTGYKQTEVGVIPEEWEVKSIAELGVIKTGPFGTLLKASEYSGTEGVPLISVGEVGAGAFKIKEHTPRVPKEVVRRLPQYVLRTGDIVFGRKGAVERSALVTENENGWFLGSDGISVRPHALCFPPYLACQFQRQEVQGWLLQHAIGTTMASLNQGILNRVQIPYAPLPEQRAIAAALSDVDGLLGALDRLIAKKRDLKQAAMQQLLTGQTRLPGFKGELVVKTLGEVVNCSPSGTYGVERQSTNLLPMAVATTAQITNTDRWNGKAMHTRFFTSDQLDTYGVSVGDLVVVKSSGSAASIQSGKMVHVDQSLAGTFLFSNFLMRLRPTSIDSKFLYFFLTSTRIKGMLPSLCEASTYPNIRINEYLEIDIPIPEPAEQTAIASVLSEMDAELAGLEQRREKTRALKQGMMQELLTGRTRLV